MGSIYLLDAAGSALPASSPGTWSWAPNSETLAETWTPVDWLTDLGCLFVIRSRKSFKFSMPPPFFFDFFAAVDEGWSAMEITSRVTVGPKCHQIEPVTVQITQLSHILQTRPPAQLSTSPAYLANNWPAIANIFSTLHDIYFTGTYFSSINDSNPTNFCSILY